MTSSIRPPKFVISRVHGKAAGGAVGLIAASDFSMATTKASAKLSELAVGIGPFVVTLYFFLQNVNRVLPPNL